jgi:tryptophan-rich sensory protein
MTELLQIIILVPAVIGYLAGYTCKVQETSGESVKFRPPPKVFGIAWAILYILLGLSWYYALKSTINIKMIITIMIFYILLNIALCSWIYLYSCKKDKITAVYGLAISFTFALMCYTLGNITSKLCIVPLIGWLFFATLINVGEILEIK